MASLFRQIPHSAPQSSQGCAVTAAIITLRRRLTGLRRIRMRRTQGTHNRHQVRELRTLLRKFPAPDDLFALEAQLLALEAQLATKHRESWTGWCREQWAAHPGRLYRYIKGGAVLSNTQLHHGDRGAPSSLQDRLSALVSHWNTFWGHGPEHPLFPPRGIAGHYRV